MAQVFRPTANGLDIAGCLPAEFQASSRLAMQLLEAVEDLFIVDRMSWRPKMDDAVVYLLLNDDRPIFSDMVAGLAVLRPSEADGRIRLGFTREPATDALQSLWAEEPPIVRRRAWPNPIQDIASRDLDAAERTLRAYRELLVNYADRGELRRSGTSRPELRMRRTLQRMFPEAGFARVRPSWLLGTKGKSLELDIYSEALNIAVEVQGPYHDRPINGVEVLAQQQHRDALKRKQCAERGVKLLLVNAAALDLEIFTLPRDEQERQIGELLELTTALGFYEWPEQSPSSLAV
jgi:hypothetical protein